MSLRLVCGCEEEEEGGRLRFLALLTASVSAAVSSNTTGAAVDRAGEDSEDRAGAGELALSHWPKGSHPSLTPNLRTRLSRIGW